MYSSGSGGGTQSTTTIVVFNLIGFWLLGLCNNFAYVIMLSAAKDILDQEEGDSAHRNSSGGGDSDQCSPTLVQRQCSSISTGAVLLADILPSLIVKLIAPFFIHIAPFGLRHMLIILFQAASYLVVAFSQTVPVSLIGVVLASIGAGFGEITYLALSAHFSSHVISAWSSGTGAAGILGALVYALFTEPHLFGLSPRTSLLIMLIVPIIFALAYWRAITMPNTVHQVVLTQPNTYLILNPINCCGCCRQMSTDPDEIDPLLVVPERDALTPSETIDCWTKIRVFIHLLKYMIPLCCVYIGEYLINQGLVELIIFDCNHSFYLSKSSQYRWYQVMYQLGVFISRSSVHIIPLPTNLLPLLAVIQITNAVLFLFDAIYRFVPHIGIILSLILFEGILGGCAYVNTFNTIHQTTSIAHKEFSLSIASVADSFGITIAGFAAIPIHNIICSMPFH